MNGNQQANTVLAGGDWSGVEVDEMRMGRELGSLQVCKMQSLDHGCNLKGVPGPEAHFLECSCWEGRLVSSCRGCFREGPFWRESGTGFLSPSVTSESARNSSPGKALIRVSEYCPYHTSTLRYGYSR